MKKTKKLKLNRETLSDLRPVGQAELKKIAGGCITFLYDCEDSLAPTACGTCDPVGCTYTN